MFVSFNGGNKKSILLFGSLNGREWNGYEEILILLYFLKTLNFHSLQNWEELEGMKLDLMNFLLTPKIQLLYFEILQHPQTESAHRRKHTELSTDL